MNDSEPNREANPNSMLDLQKPTLAFETVVFSSGQCLHFNEDDIVVFVGPNNAGKSALLREMEKFVSKHVSQKVLIDASFTKRGTRIEFEKYLEKYSLKVGEITKFHYAGIGYNINHQFIGFFDNEKDRHPVAPFFCMRLATETRITDSNPAPVIALYRERPTHPIHSLLMDDKLTNRICSLFRRAFGLDLIPFRAGGGQFPLYVGDKPVLKAGEDELSRSFVDRLQESAVLLHEQGDGMRSFASVLLHVLVSDHHSIQFLDEPEAFLHPPQARLLGEIIAHERKAHSQLFIATHSTDVLDGLIAGGASNLRIVRIQREGSVNKVKELSKEKTSAIINDTLARYSGVFDGIFYQHVIICESDADCLFYSTILHLPSISGDRRADVLFIHTSGKHRMAKLAETLRDLDVPVSVIADIDLLKEENTFKGLIETLGGDWSEIVGHHKAIKTAIEQQKPSMNSEQVVRLVRDELDGLSGLAEFPKQKQIEIKRILNSISSWDGIKRSGRPALPGGQVTKHFDDLTRKCSEVGLWIVQVGELEGFCRSIDGGHGPSFVAKVLEQRNLEGDPELEDVRKFVANIWDRARPK